MVYTLQCRIYQRIEKKKHVSKAINLSICPFRFTSIACICSSSILSSVLVRVSITLRYLCFALHCHFVDFTESLRFADFDAFDEFDEFNERL